MLARMIRKQASNEQVPGIPRNHAGERAIVKVRILGHSLVEALGGILGHDGRRERLSLRHHVVPGLEAREVHGIVVARDVEIVTCGRRVGLDEVVRADETLRST